MLHIIFVFRAFKWDTIQIYFYSVLSKTVLMLIIFLPKNQKWDKNYNYKISYTTKTTSFELVE